VSEQKQFSGPAPVIHAQWPYPGTMTILPDIVWFAISVWKMPSFKTDKYFTLFTAKQNWTTTQ